MTISSDQTASSARPAVETRRVYRVSDRDTQRALRAARRIRRGPITVSCVPDRSEYPRVSYSVGRRAGGAVQRNRIRRRLRAAITELGPDLEGRAWLFGAGAEAADLGFSRLSEHCRAAVDGLSR